MRACFAFLSRIICPACAAALASPGIAIASDYSQLRSIAATASVSTNPDQISLGWPRRADLDSYTIEIIAPDGTTRVETAAANSIGYVDTAVEAGSLYEYRVRGDRQGTTLEAFGVVLAGIEAPLIEDRGIVVLVVDSTKSAGLAAQLARLRRDFIGDGWRVERIDVSPQLPPVAVRELIRSIYLQSPNEVKAALLLGNIAVPYSGVITPDGHYGVHTGAWPADVYYGEMDGAWSDTLKNVVTATRPENHNTPWDGKFDVSMTTTDIELAIGRVDFSDLPAFADSEEALLAAYLDKNHRYRNHEFSLEPKGFLHDGLSWLSSAPGIGAYHTSASCFGPNQLTKGSWDTALQDINTSYAIAWGFSTGSYTYLNGITSTTSLTTRDYRAGFGFFMGSYSGDWDSSNNLLRAALASGAHTVATGWSGRPVWNLHPLGMGKTIGEALLSTQNHRPSANAYVGYGSRFIHVALMGDPTLRLHTVAPPVSLTLTEDALGKPALSWQLPTSGPTTFHVYRANDWESDFFRLTQTPIATTSYVDVSSPPNAVYMVRSVLLQTSGGGTYHNSSQGAFQEWGVAPQTAPKPNITVTGLETDFYEKGDRTATFTVTRDGDLSLPLAIAFSVGGVVADVDVQSFDTSLTIPADAAQAELTLTALSNGVLNEDRAVTFLVIPSQDYVINGNAMVAATLHDAPFDQWRKENFTVSELNNASISGEHADLDEDQVPNLMEYVLGSNPWVKTGLEMDVFPAAVDGDHDIVQFTKAVGEAQDVTLIIETCTDGVSWLPTLPLSQTIVQSPVAPDLELVTCAFVAEPQRCFFRITVTSVPE